MLELTDRGLYCPAGDFYIDPSRGVKTALITHAHSDHARRGSQLYLCEESGAGLLKSRLGPKIQVQTAKYREPFQIGPVRVSLHSAGHILGSAQVRLEHDGEIWVVSGDYKREPDPTCEPFEVVPCDVFVTEATFGTPAYRWNHNRSQRTLGAEIHEWWNECAAEGCHAVVFAYSLGKAQRVLGELLNLAHRPILTHPAVTELTERYREEGIQLAPTLCLSQVKHPLRGELIVAPPSSEFDIPGRYRTAFASGWMAHGTRGYDHGFLMSDHADWDDLIRTIRETGAKQVFVQHRETGALVRYLKSELKIDAYPESALCSRKTPGRQLTLL